MDCTFPEKTFYEDIAQMSILFVKRLNALGVYRLSKRMNVWVFHNFVQGTC